MGLAIANSRLKILAQAKPGVKVTDVCKRNGISRTLFYRWRSRYAAEGLAGLVDRAPIAAAHPMAVPGSVAELIAMHALALPSAGCRSIAAQLKARGVKISPATVYKILKSQGLGSRRQRWLKLEHDLAAKSTSLSNAQLQFVMQCNPAIGCRRYMPSFPGEILFGGCFRVDCAGSGRRAAVAVVVDGFSGFAYAIATLSLYRLHTAEPLLAAIKACGFYPHTLVSGKTFRDNSAITPILRDHDVQDVVLGEGTIGFVERFRASLVSARTAAFASLAYALPQQDNSDASFRAWLEDYNGTIQDGYPCYGQAPAVLNASDVNKARRQGRPRVW